MNRLVNYWLSGIVNIENTIRSNAIKIINGVIPYSVFEIRSESLKNKNIRIISIPKNISIPERPVYSIKKPRSEFNAENGCRIDRGSFI